MIEIKRRFLQVGDRAAHYLRAGSGRPLVLVHSSPANTSLLIPLIERLAPHFTCFAFDTPGFGDSDPVAPAPTSVADLADALAATLDAIGMPACPMFGTHTGAAIALEFGRRHPARVTGLVLDGVPIFTAQEIELLFEGYFEPLALDGRGGHYAATWTRFRDQYIWFPWTSRDPARLNQTDLGAPEQIHLWVSMFFQCAAHYKTAYRAAVTYGEAAVTAAAALRVPAVFTAHDTDMLFPHLERLPPLARDQHILRLSRADDLASRMLPFLTGFAGRDTEAPSDRQAPSIAKRIARSFCDLPHGQMLVRRAGTGGPQVLLLHDAPGSGEMLEPALRDLAAGFTVTAPDLPGCADSAALAEQASLDAYADAIAALAPDDGPVTVCGVGIGAAVGLAFASRHPHRVRTLMLAGLPLPTPSEREDLEAHLTPPIVIGADGGHWYRTWLMLRDSLIYAPWYRTRVDALKRTPADFSAERLHRWCVSVMKQHATYHRVIRAALADDAAERLRRLTVPLTILEDPSGHFGRFAPAVRQLTPKAPVIAIPRNGSLGGTIRAALS